MRLTYIIVMMKFHGDLTIYFIDLLWGAIIIHPMSHLHHRNWILENFCDDSKIESAPQCLFFQYNLNPFFISPFNYEGGETMEKYYQSSLAYSPLLMLTFSNQTKWLLHVVQDGLRKFSILHMTGKRLTPPHPSFQHSSPTTAIWYPIACLQLDLTVPYVPHCSKGTLMVTLLAKWPDEWGGLIRRWIWFTQWGQLSPGMV